MELTYLGNGSVRLAGRQVSIVTDPLEGAGKKSTADVSLVTGAANPFASGLVIDTPGEYEVKGAMITGVPVQLHVDESGKAGTAYVIQTDDIKIGILGNVAPTLDTEALEQLSELDALIIPVGGHGLTLDATAAMEIVSKLEPKYVIPVHYANKASKYEVPQDDLSKFQAEMGAAATESVTKIKLSGKDLPEETTLVVLDPMS